MYGHRIFWIFEIAIFDSYCKIEINNFKPVLVSFIRDLSLFIDIFHVVVVNFIICLHRLINKAIILILRQLLKIAISKFTKKSGGHTIMKTAVNEINNIFCGFLVLQIACDHDLHIAQLKICANFCANISPLKII